MTIQQAAETAVTSLVDAGLGQLICHADSDLYRARIADFWSLTAQKKPYAIIHPETTEDVVKIVKVLVNNKECQFAVRSGGHVPWGASNIEGGILVDLGLHLTSVSVSTDKSVVSVQPGARWRDVYKFIEPHNIAVAGGRTGGVGVAGLLTGGGISWYIPRVGFCCDQIINAEVVLADGSLVSANANENEDLWRALKGANASNFGIVTRFDLKTLPWDGLWAGMLVSEASPENTAKHVAAMNKFVEGSEDLPDSSYIVLWNYEPTAFKKVIITSFAANTKGVESPPELAQLLDIPAIVKDMKQTTLHDFACTMEQPYEFHNFWHTTTFLNDPRIMAKAVEFHAATVAKMKAASETGHFSTLCLFQALPNFYGKLSDAAGGNVMGIDQHLQGRNAVSMLLSVNVSEEGLREYGLQLAREYLGQVEDYARSVDGYVPWYYVNYADRAQKPLSSLLDPRAIMRVAEKYDGEGVFQKQVPGGFKISECKMAYAHVIVGEAHRRSAH